MASEDLGRQIECLLKDIGTLSTQIENVHDHGLDRAKLLQATKRLASALEKPADVVFHNAFLPVQSTCVRVAVDLGLFELIARETQDKRPVTAKELAAQTQAEHLLIVRILRVLGGVGFVAEVGEESYTATPLTIQMTLPAYQACIRHHFDFGTRTLAQLPAWFKSNGYRSPTSATSGPLQHIFNTNLSSFDYWATLPCDVMQNFNTYMTGNESSGPSWVEWYPVEDNVLRGAKEDDDTALIVDVAGGRGHYLETFRQKFPNAKGRMILQDLPHVISDVQDFESRIECMAHDMFSPQPIQGARVYFLHFVLHDWSEARAAQILKQIAAAMAPGYSKLILGEFILPDTAAPFLASGFDWQMMVLHSGMERSERQWRELIKGVGLEIVAFWQGKEGVEGIIEVVKRG